MQHTETENLKKNSGEEAQPPPQTPFPLGGAHPSPNLTPVGAFGASIFSARPAAPPLSSFAPPPLYHTSGYRPDHIVTFMPRLLHSV